MPGLPRTDPVRPELPEASFQQASGVLGARQGDTTVLLDVNGGTYYTLNEVGARIWELLGTGAAVSAVVEQLKKEYSVAPDQLSADTAALIDRLHQAKLVKQAGR